MLKYMKTISLVFPESPNLQNPKLSDCLNFGPFLLTALRKYCIWQIVF